MPDFKVICVDRSEGWHAADVRPFIVSVPDSITNANDSKVRNWALRLQWSEDGIRRWSQTQTYFTEGDAKTQPIIKSMFESVDWNSVSRSWFKEPSNPEEALEYARIVGCRVEEYEHLIAQDSEASFSYSCEIDNPFPAGEQLIAKDPTLSIRYADAHGMRMITAEDKISENDVAAEDYGKIMNSFSLWDTWQEDEVTRSPVWIYMYSRKIKVPESIHNAMVMFSFRDATNKWVRKYFGKKKSRTRT